MSTTILAVIINLLAVGLPYIGVTIGTEELTNAVQVLFAIITGAWIWYQRVKRGDVTVVGARK